MNNTNTDYSF